MQVIKNLSPVARAMVVFGSMMGLVAGVTIAALDATATLADNSVTTATADLNVWDGQDWADSGTGFTLEDQIPGEWSDPQPFYLQNTSPFAMDITVTVPTEQITSSGISSLADIGVRFSDEAGQQITVVDLLTLTNEEVDLGQLDAGAAGVPDTNQDPGDFYVSFLFEYDGVSGSSASVSGFSFQFDTTQIEVAAL